jgi:urease beta subunit
MFRAIIALVLAGSALAGCASRPNALDLGATVAIEPTQADRAWRKVAVEGDQPVVDGLHDRFARIRAALPRRFARAAEGEGPLLDPAAAQTLPALPPGPYYCRLVRLGGRRGVASFEPDLCYVAAAKDALAFSKQTGSNLPEGYIYEDGDTRAVFLGTFRTAGQPESPGYGVAAGENIVGIVERVSSFRWRLILSRAGGGATLDMYELVPVPPQVPGAKPAVPSD